MTESKSQKELQRLEKDLKTDLADITGFVETKKDKFKTAILRKYGPLKDIFSSPLRKEFKKRFEDVEFSRCQEIIYQLNFKRASNIKDMARSTLLELEERFLFAAKEAGLNVSALAGFFKKEYRNLAKQPAADPFREGEAKKNIRFI